MEEDSLDSKKYNIKQFAFPILTLIYLEVSLHLATLFSIDLNILLPIAFSIPIGLVLYLLCSFFSSKVNGIIYCIIIGIISLYFIVQLVYHEIFQNYLQIYLLKIGGFAVFNFWRNMLSTILEMSFVILLLIIPFTFTVRAVRKKKIIFEKSNIRKKVLLIITIVVLHIGCLACLTIGGTSSSSNYAAYFSNSANTDTSVIRLGVMTTARLETANILFPDIFTTSKIKLYNLSKPINKKAEETTDQHDIKNDDEPTPTDYNNQNYNIINIDFDKLIKNDTDENLAMVDEYFSQITPTPKNKYTGIFKDCNLVVLCCESFSKYLIDEKITPTLYKLSHEGFIFNNFYSPFDSNTTNGEYTACMGMFPDLLRSKSDNSFIGAADNYLPFTYGNMFSLRGVHGYAYHNYFGTYYSRDLSHPNMGYTFKAPDSGLAIEVSWPSSDYDMMVASVDDYISSDKQFLAYYMTFSGHYQYNWDNPMSAKNREEIESMGLDFENDTVLSYISCNLELEKALTYLMERLEESGVAENTVIILTNDHYPYGLTETDYNELAGEPIDTTFGRYKNSFICWYGGLEQPIEIDTPCCSIDILPTMLNLFGFNYDSRLLLGKDILSDCEHIAILSNKSFINEYVMFDGNTGKCTYFDEDENKQPTKEQLLYWESYVEDTFTLSKAILDYDYFEHVREYIESAIIETNTYYNYNNTSATTFPTDTTQN